MDPFLASLALAPVLTAWTAARTRAITRAFPPRGRFIETRAGRLHVVDSGEGLLPVVFLHGASGNVRTWEPALGRRLGRLGRTILIDRPGHGFSERRAGRATVALDHQAGAVIDVLDVLGLPRAVIVAHSLAGALACRLALDHGDRVAGLVLLAPVTHPWPGGVHWYYRVAATPLIGPLFAWTLVLPLGELWMKRSIQGVFMPQSVSASYSDEAAIALVLRPRQFMANAEDVAGLFREVAAQAPRYAEIACPVTVISGNQDSVVWTHLHSLGTARDVTQTRLVLLDGVGHGPHHAAPDQVVEEIERMLAASTRGMQPGDQPSRLEPGQTGRAAS
ncbi:alpha/beta fold hydrolase [Phreatobacter stygius]|uniref:Alpha/beta hydrolase n=1 Tax=Phreatobacter stygius TaxID=1940610 RepID=A0A4D7AVE6_9HYPH|nr:alpha/beta hydrolase [Phreatobacter stygius]QCI63545.1 alpha/beta hydrolase [Phreatobacter stygius]